ncbi:MAG: FAD-dependent oxidoreductase [Vicinamibacterales bacterium]
MATLTRLPTSPTHRRSVVLLGAGHTHLHALKHWREQAPPGATLTCISDYPVATYSGMLTGVLAGDYLPAAMEVPLAPLCEAANAALVVGQVARVDLHARAVTMGDGRVVAFDLLSVGVGSTPATRGVEFDRASSGLVAIKPMQTFLARMRDALLHGRVANEAPRVVIVGGGAAGVELALCLPTFVSATIGSHASFTLVADGPILPDCSAGLMRRAAIALERAGVAQLSGRVVRVADAQVHLDSGSVLDAELIVWTTGASPRQVLSLIDLPKDSAGFLATDDTLRSTGDPRVFAVGDAGAIAERPVPKAGVYAVKQGPVLLDNLRRTLNGQPLRPFVPQRSFLKLLNAGGGHALGEWRGVSFEGRWCRWLKERIDTRFIAQFQR